MKKLLLSLILLVIVGVTYSQSVFDPNDPVINYVSTDPTGPTNPQVQFTYNIVKWVRTPKMTWDASRYKCYLIGNVPFRLRFPNSYRPGVSDGKKYPIMLFFHGGGEANAEIHDNEFQLYNGAQTFGNKIDAGGQDAFVLFPQSKTVGWGDTYFVPMNIVIDSLIKNCKGDPDRVLSMGLSIGGAAAIDYATEYPQRASSIITSSPVYMRGYAATMGPAVHLPIWLGNGGLDTNPSPDDVNYFESQYNANLGGDLTRSFYANQNHVMWDSQWGEEPKFNNTITNAHKANPLIFFGKKSYCPGATVSSKLGITQGFAEYQWDKNGVIIPGAASNEYTATDFGTYRARFRRTSGSDWSAWSPVPAVITAICVGTGTGLKGTYYNNVNLTPPSTATRTDARVNFTWNGSTSPISGVGGTNFSIRWTGKVQPQYSETYTFYTTSDDGIRVWVNGVQVINNFTDHGPTDNSGTINLVAYQKYDIKIEYYNSAGGAAAILSWSSPSIAKAIVPTSQLYPDGTGNPDLPLCTTNTSPANGSTIAAGTSVALSWNSIFNASSYDVYVWTGATPPSSPTANVTTNTYTATGLAGSSTYNWYIVPKNITGSATGCGTNNKTTFITQAGVPACAINTVPANTATIVTPTSAALTWGAVTNATSYDVYIWSGTTPPAIATTTVTAPTVSYTATSLTPGTLYNWYIIPKNTNGPAVNCDVSAKTTFTTGIIVPVPSCTTNGTPVNGAALGTQITADLTWAAAANATSYDVYVYIGTTIPSSPTINIAAPAVTYTAIGLTANTTYNWFVVPKNATGSPTGCSANATSFATAPLAPLCTTNLLPANNATLVPSIATLSWTAAPTATSYDIYLYTGTAVPASPTATVSGVNSYTTSTVLPYSTTYNWFVVPKNAGGSPASCSGNATSFTTLPPPVPSCTPNLTPAVNATLVPITATVTWTAAATATSYDVYIYTGAEVPTLPTATVTGVTTYTSTIALAYSTAYNWFVVPRNASGPATGCAGNVTSFTTVPIPAPTCTPNVTPAANATLVPITATLTWTAAANATGYDVYVYTGTVVPGAPTVTVTGATTFTTAALTNSTTYNWFVIPKNASGSATGCSGNVTSFTTIPVPAPSCTPNITPAINATLVPITATFTWTAAANATGYDIYVYTGTVVPGSPTATVTGVTTYTTTTNLAYATTYNWFVVPKNASGSATGCSGNATVFTTIPVPAPLCTPNVTPANNATLIPAAATLTWTAAPDATSYDVFLWTGGIVPSTPVATVAAVSYDASGLLANSIYNWYVVPKNTTGSATGCSTSNKFTFTTAPTLPPLCTSNISPSGSVVLTTPTTAALTWTVAANADSYDVYVWTGGTAPSTPVATVTSANYIATGLAASSLYNWYVVPKNAGGTATGCAGNATSFTTAVDVPACTATTLPVSGTPIGTPTTASLTWTASPGATSYDVYVYTGAAIPSLATATVTAPTLTYNATGLTALTTYNWFVVPKNITGAAANCNLSFKSTFTTSAIATPICATNVSPANTTTIGSQTSITLTWGTVPTATSYDVYLWPGGVAPASPIANVADGSYSTASLTAGTTYTWYVVPRNSSGGASGCAGTNAWTFTTQSAPVTPPECATNLSPAGGTVLGTQTSGLLAWSTVITASSYDVYLWSGTTPPTAATITVGVNSYNPTNLAPATTYSWYVVPRNTGGPAVGCSGNILTFTTAAIPVPLCAVNSSPQSGTTILTQNTASLTWGNIVDATSYDVYIWTGATVPTTATATVTTNSYAASGLVANTTYNWYVVSKNASGPATGCDQNNKSTFTTAQIPAPSCTTYSSPIGGIAIATSTSAPLVWAGALNATSYDVYIWTGAIVPTTATATVTTNAYTATGLTANSTYNWYVVPKNLTGSATGCAGNASTFVTAPIPAPSCTPNVTPANSATLVPVIATLTWTAATNATAYDVYVYKGTVVPGSPTATVSGVTTYTTAALAYSTSYNWFVVPKNTTGGATGCSGNATSFTTIAIPVPSCTTNVTPLANAALVPVTATLTWTAAANAIAYDVYVYTGMVVPGLPTATVTGVTTFTTTILSNSTTYNWFVVPKNASGSATGCSGNATAFTTIPAPVPSCTPNVTPAASATLVPITATLSWTAAPTATSYDVYIYTGTAVPTLPTATVGTVTTYTTTTNLVNSTTYNWFVVPKNASGSATGCSGNATAFTSVPIPVPSCTTALTPANNATLVPVTATLTWTAAGNATGYDIYVYTGTVVPGSPTATVTGVTTFTTAVLAYATTYNWFVVPKNASGSATGCLGNATAFTTIPAPVTTPSCTTNLTPANSATLVPITATLTWTAAANATGYDVYVYTGTVVPGSPTSTVTGVTTFTTAALAYATTYNWFIVPKNASGSATGCSSNKFNFTTVANVAGTGLQGTYYSGVTLTGTPLLTRVDPTVNFDIGNGSPAPGTVPVDLFSVRWTGQVKAVYSETYTFYTDADDGIRLWVNGVQLVNNWVDQGTTEKSGTISLVAGQKYDIIVEYYESGGGAVAQLQWSSPSTAKAIVPQAQLYPTGIVTPVIISCTINTAPATGSTLTTSTGATLSWAAVTGAASYDVYVYTGATAPASPTSNSSATTYVATGLTGGSTYNWFVIPKNAAGNAAGCGTISKSTFITANATATDGTGLQGVYYNGITLTGTPLLTRIDPTIDFDLGNGSPAPGIVPVDLYSVRWTGQVKAVYSEAYTFYTTADDGIRLWVNGTQLVNNFVDQGPTEKSGTITLVAGQKYDIVVEYYENTGGAISQLRWSSASTPKAIVPQTQLYPPGTVAPPSCTTNLTPANNAALTPITATLTWTAAANATSYDVYVYTGTVVPTSPTATVTGATTYTTAALAYSSGYNWFVVPGNAGGAATGCSGNATAFTTIPVPVPSCTNNLTPSNAAILGASTIATLTWTAAANATAYDVYVYTGTVVPGSPTGTVTGVTTYTAVSLTASTTYNWFVVPKNTTGGATGCSTSNKFTFTTAAAGATLGTGLQGTYYNGVTLTGTPLLTRIDPTIDFDLGNGSPVPGTVPVDLYSVRWTGQVKAVFSEMYTFYTKADDGIRLWVNGVQLVNNWVDQGTTERSGTISLVAGQKYDIIVEYYESGGGAFTQLQWSSASTPRATVPQVQLYPTGIVTPVIISCTVNTAPATGSTTSTSTVATLSWNAIAGATSYDVYLYTGATAPASPTASTSASSYAATGLTAASTYNWFVIPKNAAGNAAGCGVTNKSTFITANASVTDGTGLQGVYYNGTALSGTPLLTRIDPVVDFDLGDGSPAPGIVPVDAFSIRWTGQVKAVYSETYSFYTTADDGIRLWVNGIQLVDNWINQAPTEKSGTITLVAGQKYDIVVEYYESAYGAIAQLRWSSATTPKAIIPQTQLYPASGTGALVSNAVTAQAIAADNRVASAAPSLTSSISPNPITPGQSARLQITSDKTATAMISIINSVGYIISTQKVNLLAGVNTASINTSMLGQGFYIINITGGDKPVNVKLLVE